MLSRLRGTKKKNRRVEKDHNRKCQKEKREEGGTYQTAVICQ
jgi:hypothetical protein